MTRCLMLESEIARTEATLNFCIRALSEKLRPLPSNLTLWPGHDYLLNNLKFALTVDPENQKLKSSQKAGENGRGQRIHRDDSGREFEINPFLRLDKLAWEICEYERKRGIFRIALPARQMVKR